MKLATKPVLAQRMIARAVKAGVPFGWVTGDEAYGVDTKLRMWLESEAERERRARIISADGEYQASQKLSDAARVMRDTPAALQLRLLETVVQVASEKNSTLVLPFPVELLRFSNDPPTRR